MSSYQSISQRKEEFRKYLESNGVVDAITKVFVGLYEQEARPEDPLQYIRQNLGGKEAEDLQKDNENLKNEIKRLTERLSQLETQNDADQEETDEQNEA
eukprot:CAMPEP_0117441170 /NCGR_PEP_ID=MMETSP0759-20121206/3494_1 /TAXON_ID=63605 /ORGANISM="Percolomonas cosmopolitus, Strain WS" /LENGTH=98 /DNA_ID=CAMNT_0005233011 /DNA_START=60 /DNA_END=356 /DNA_ORIENTATION=+